MLSRDCAGQIQAGATVHDAVRGNGCGSGRRLVEDEALAAVG
jgi:hypothetical protein